MLREKRIQTIQTTEHALELLQIISSGRRDLSLKRLSQRLKISREEVLMLLVAMENRGLVAWNSREKTYDPGGAALEIAEALVQHNGHPLPQASL